MEEFEKVIEGLRRIKRKNPEWRLGQMVFNIADWGFPGRDVFYLSDEEFVALSHKYTDNLDDINNL